MDTSEKLSLHTFLGRLRALTGSHREPDWDQEAHVARVAALASALDLEDPAVLALCADPFPGRGVARITTRYREDGFELSTLAFDPGDAVPLHDHPGMTGVILCVSGAVLSESFELLDERSARDNPLLWMTERTHLRPHQIRTLTAARNNIHSLRAASTARMIDIFTPPYNDERSANTRYFRRDQTPYKDRPDVFEARDS